MPKLVNLPKEFLEEQYSKQGKSVKDIHNEFGYSFKTIYSRLKKYDLTRNCGDSLKLYIERHPEYRKVLSVNSSGKNNPMFGRVGVRCPIYLDGRTNKKYYCLDCNKPITYQSANYGSHKCRSCGNKGQIRTEKICLNISKSLIEKWKNKDFRENLVKKRKLQMTEEVKNKICKKLQSRTITGLEKKVLNTVNKYQLPFKYVGDGSFILHGLNPDFSFL
jgi:ribosomal protein L37AE/L43A